MLLDESGLLMAPLVRRSWSPRGRPPPLRQKARHREKVSVAGALWLSPSRGRLRLFWQTIIDGYFDNEAVAGFLGDLMSATRRPAVVVWDGGNMHKGEPINELVARSGGRLDLERLPAHAAELMPLEQLWSWLKYSRLCNFAPADAARLNEEIFRELDGIEQDQHRLRNLFHASALPLPRALLS